MSRRAILFVSFLLINFVFVESFAQTRPRRRGGGQNQSGCWDGDTGRKVPCPRNGDLFPSRGANPNSEDYVDGSDEWDRRYQDQNRLVEICEGQRRGKFRTDELLNACLLGIRAARLYGRQVGSAVGSMEGFYYGASAGLDEGAYEGEYQIDDRQRNRLIGEGRDQYNGSIQVQDRYVLNQLSQMSRILISEESLQNEAGERRGSSLGPGAARAQYVEYTLGQTTSAPDRGQSNNPPYVTPPQVADPMGSKIGYSSIETIIQEQILELPPSVFNDYYSQRDELFYYLNEYYGPGVLTYERMYSGRGNRYRAQKEAYIPRRPDDAFQVMDQYTRRSRRRGGTPLGNLLSQFDSLSGPLDRSQNRIPGADKRSWIVNRTDTLCGRNMTKYQDNPQGIEQARRETVFLYDNFCLCTTPAQDPDVPPRSDVPAPVCKVASFTLPDGVPDRVSGKTAFHMGFVGAFKRFFDHSFQRSFAQEMNNAYDIGLDIGFDAGIERVVEQGRALEYEIDFNERIATAYTEGYDLGYKVSFENTWDYYDNNPVLEVKTIGLTGDLGERVFRPEETLSAELEIINYGGRAASLTPSVSGNYITPGSVVLSPNGEIAAFTANARRSLNNFATVTNPINPIRGIPSSQLSVTLTPQRGQAKSALWNFSVQEWVSLADSSLSYSIDYDARKGNFTVRVKNNSLKHQTPQTVKVVPSVSSVGELEVADLDYINPGEVKEHTFEIEDLVRLDMLEGSYQASIKVYHGDDDLVIHEGPYALQMDQLLVRALAPEMANNILLDGGRAIEGLINSYNYQRKASLLDVGEPITAENATTFNDRAMNLVGKFVEAEIRSGVSTQRYSTTRKLIELYLDSHNYNHFQSGWDSSTRRYRTSDDSVMNRVATANYIINYSNMAWGWERLADDVDRDEEEDLDDLLESTVAIHKDRPEYRDETFRMVPWEERDMYEVPRGKSPKEKEIRFYWMDGLHPGLVMATEDMSGFTEYYRGEKGDRDLKLPRHLARDVKEW